MGLWDHQIADLEAIGLRFSEAELRALEEPAEGLQVLHLQPLWDPDTPEGQVCFVQGPDQGVIYVPEILDLWHPAGPYETYRGAPLWQAMESEHGIMDEGYPFYFATLDYRHEPVETPLSMYRSDEPKPYPFHGCLPLESDLEVEAAKRLVNHARVMIHDSVYGELDFLVEVERASDWCLEVSAIWEEVVMGTELPLEVKKTIEQELENHGDPEMARRSIVTAFQTLIDEGFVADPRWTPEQEAAYKQVPMKVGPLTDYIPDSDFLARDLYSSITARQRHFQRRWEQMRGTYPLQNLLAREGVYI